MGKAVKIFFVVLFFLATLFAVSTKSVSAQVRDCGYDYSCQKYQSQTCYNYTSSICSWTPNYCWDYWPGYGFYSYICGYTPQYCWSATPYECGYWYTGTCHQFIACTPPPTIQFEAIPRIVSYGGSTILAWAATNATNCYASGGQNFSGYSISTTGIQSIYNLTTSQTFTILCSGGGGWASQSVSVTVAPPSPPVVNLTATPNPVDFGSSTVLLWSSTGATTCYNPLTTSWGGTSGSYVVPNMTVTRDFWIQCTGAGGATTKYVTVTVNARRGLNAAIQTCINGNWTTTGTACIAQSSCTQIVANCVPSASICAGKCGVVPDGCPGNGTINCGNTCTGVNSCGGGGTANQCGCTPTTNCAAQGRTCGTINNGCGVVSCGGACAVCGNSVCEAGETAATCPADCGNTVSGTVYTDTAGNNCASGATAYSGGATVTLYTGASSSGAGVSNGAGVYSARSSVPAGQRTAVISNVLGYTVGAVRYQGGAWGISSLSGYTYGPFTHNSNQTLDWCLTNVKPWYQVDKGDVRRVSLANKVPSGQYLSTDVNYPGVPISSAWSTDLGLGQASAKNWKVDDEYSYNKNSSNKNGSVAYSYYKNRAASTSKTIASIPGCANGGSASCSLSNLASGIYEFDGGGTGTLTITGYTHRAGAHVTILINGNVTIVSNISIPEGAGNLLVLAAKGNITIDKSVGQVSVSSVATNIDGIYSAEGKITIGGDTCPSGTPDRRLNVGGVLIANSKKPFTTGGAGIIDNKRSLCSANDATYPSLYVKSRHDFLFQLTDFYLVPTGRYSQVQP